MYNPNQAFRPAISAVWGG
ncbi:putative leader peptide RepB (plasmid) [Yersinia enterocolitica subsp. enterocolitica 8081]|uniref:Leader peptide RepB n=2 Tax=Yersinia enterocolitica TaxID=630 RepID=A1JUD3_YERE8|nr:putative leader peptide RepB [Yersinia enterocolitica]AAO39034.1 putative leader peptide RepB [Yersinia enterocolitica]CAL10112.1 putative leader peptide RepB [Yersinia enterocolitica subsp. enterocolitica 8081]CBW54749.1 annotated in pYVa127/90 as putative leader peptide RepB [Yersinia enterocolitica (type O:8)]